MAKNYQDSKKQLRLINNAMKRLGFDERLSLARKKLYLLNKICYLIAKGKDKEADILIDNYYKNLKNFQVKRKRKQFSRAKRFRILEKSNFRCIYCGKKPPETEIHIDHKIPLSQGGSDDEDNLFASCKDCNLGKSDKLLKQSVDKEVK